MANILLAEDEPDLRHLIWYTLSQAGHEVEAVGNGREALRRAQAPGEPGRRPALVIADIMMPGLDGFSMAVRLGLDDATAAIPVVFLSGQTYLQDSCRTLRNVRAFLSKPFDPKQLVETVGQALSRS